MINKELEKKLKENLEFSEKLCEVLNEYVKYENVKYIGVATSEDIGVRQVLDKRGLQYNTIYIKDEVINECSLIEIVDLVWLSLGRGDYWAVVPSEKEINLYDKLKDNDWLNQDIWINEECLYINNEEFYIEDIEEIKINKDIIELQFKSQNEEYYNVTVRQGLEIKTESIRKNKIIPFNILFDKEEKFVRNMNVNEINIAVPLGKIYSRNEQLYYKDKLGEGSICNLNDITEICYLVNKNEYQIGFNDGNNQTEFGYFNKYGFEM